METRYWWAIVPSLGTFQLSVTYINSWEATTNIVWETAIFLCNLVQKNLMQLSNFDGIFYQLCKGVLSCLFASRSVKNWTVWRDQEVIFVKNVILARCVCVWVCVSFVSWLYVFFILFYLSHFRLVRFYVKRTTCASTGDDQKPKKNLAGQSCLLYTLRTVYNFEHLFG